MGRKSKYSIEQKVRAVQDYLDGKRSSIQIRHDLGMNNGENVLLGWVAKYKKHGDAAFYHKKHNRSYTKEFKEMAVSEYLAGKGSIEQICLKYDIFSASTLRQWIKRYNGHMEQEDYCPQGDVYMTKSRKTTLKEKIEIVKYCIENDKQYKLAAIEYEVSYAQVYQWVKKYLESGEEGLVDNRGKHKSDEEVDETESLRRKVARLERQLEESNNENELLKKVKEMERRRYLPKVNKNRNT